MWTVVEGDGNVNYLKYNLPEQSEEFEKYYYKDEMYDRHMVLDKDKIPLGALLIPKEKEQSEIIEEWKREMVNKWGEKFDSVQAYDPQKTMMIYNPNNDFPFGTIQTKEIFDEELENDHPIYFAELIKHKNDWFQKLEKPGYIKKRADGDVPGDVGILIKNGYEEAFNVLNTELKLRNVRDFTPSEVPKEVPKEVRDFIPLTPTAEMFGISI